MIDMREFIRISHIVSRNASFLYLRLLELAEWKGRNKISVSNRSLQEMAEISDYRYFIAARNELVGNGIIEISHDGFKTQYVLVKTDCETDCELDCETDCELDCETDCETDCDSQSRFGKPSAGAALEAGENRPLITPQEEKERSKEKEEVIYIYNNINNNKLNNNTELDSSTKLDITGSQEENKLILENLEMGIEDGVKEIDRGYGGKEEEKGKGKDQTRKSRASPPKSVYGEFQNVKLTETELEKLKERFPLDWQGRIEAASLYFASKGDKYRSHYATILNWARHDGGNFPGRRFAGEFQEASSALDKKLRDIDERERSKGSDPAVLARNAAMDRAWAEAKAQGVSIVEFMKDDANYEKVFGPRDGDRASPP